LPNVLGFAALFALSTVGHAENRSQPVHAASAPIVATTPGGSVLERGAVPLPVLQTPIDRFISGQGKVPCPDIE
jgi:hypothetical protein